MSKRPDKKSQREKRERLAKQAHNQKKKKAESRAKLQAQAVQLKAALSRVGCHLPFYDYLDTYESAFRQIAEESIASIPSLIGVHELPRDDFKEKRYDKCGYDLSTAIAIETGEAFPDYRGNNPDDLTLGVTVFFRNGSDANAVVFVLEDFVRGNYDRDMLYVSKVATLLHEIGHVVDAAGRGHLDPFSGRMDVVAGESFAHLYSLEQLAKRNMRRSYKYVLDIINADLARGEGYQAAVAEQVLLDHQPIAIPSWDGYLEDAMKLMAKKET